MAFFRDFARHHEMSPSLAAHIGLEVTRRRATRSETERTEFSEAKDRLKHSWAADRDDFARVKDALKKKNADHHVQNGRLSQALKVRAAPGVLQPWTQARGTQFRGLHHQ